MSKEQEFRSENGILDLRDADLVGKTVPLDGEWKFIWDNFLSPGAEDWEKPDIAMAEIPGTWNDIEIDGVNLPNTGYGSMQLRVLLPPGMDDIGMKINQVGTAYRLYVDDKFIVSNGTTGTSREESKGRFQPRTIYTKPKTNGITITMHISNYHDRFGGVWSRMYIGDAEAVAKRRYIDAGFDMLLFGMFLIISIYHLIFWYFGGRKDAFLWFGLAALMIATRTLTAGEAFLMTTFPNFDFEINHKIQFLTQTALAAFLLLSLKKIFPREISSAVVKMALLPMAAYGCVIAVAPLIIHSRLLVSFHIVLILLGLYLTAAVYAAARHNRPGGKTLFVGILVLVATTINDIMYSSNLIQTGHFVTFGIVFFSICYVITLTGHGAVRDDYSGNMTDETVLSILKEKGVSNREGEVVLHLLRGLAYDEIAEKLYISKSTVTKHVHSIYKKLGVKNRVGLYNCVNRISLTFYRSGGHSGQKIALGGQVHGEDGQ